jgi:hypothetical protein
MVALIVRLEWLDWKAKIDLIRVIRPMGFSKINLPRVVGNKGRSFLLWETLMVQRMRYSDIYKYLEN